MTIDHHPSDETLAAFTAGTLDEDRRLVVATHVALCPHCREAIRAFDEVGGALLEAETPVAMSPGALDWVMARLGDVEPLPQASTPRPASNDQDLPEPLSHYKLGPWRRIGLGVHWRSVDVPSTDGSRVFMLKAAPGTRLPHHRHTDTEWTCVLQGAFRHDYGRYGPGDFDEADETMEHKPVIEDGEPCICVVALRGGIEFQGWAGRLLQPFVRI